MIYESRPPHFHVEITAPAPDDGKDTPVDSGGERDDIDSEDDARLPAPAPAPVPIDCARARADADPCTGPDAGRRHRPGRRRRHRTRTPTPTPSPGAEPQTAGRSASPGYRA